MNSGRLVASSFGGLSTSRRPLVRSGKRICQVIAMQNHNAASNSDLLSLASRVPKGTWDTHMHVVDPRTFPLAKDAQYQPSPHTLDDAKAFLKQLGIERMVIVQPSIYGNDNSCTLDGLRNLGPKNGRAVVQFDPDTTPREQLKEWHDLGVRGVRLNFKSVGTKLSSAFLEKQMHKYADAVRELGWVLEVYIGLEDLPFLEPIVGRLGGVKVCIDHFGHPTAASISAAGSAHDVQGFASLANLLRQGQTWVKISASYRLRNDSRDPLVSSLCRELLRTRADRCVFATDWPHTRFERLEVSQYLGAVMDWIEEEGVALRQVCVDNALELFDAHA